MEQDIIELPGPNRNQAYIRALLLSPTTSAKNALRSGIGTPQEDLGYGIITQALRNSLQPVF